MILVVCALAAELRFVAPRPGVEICASGVGPVESAIATVRRLTLARYDAVVNAGIAGAFRSRARIGDAVLVESDSLADFGIENGAPLTLPGGARLVERSSADRELLERCEDTALPHKRGVTVTLVTATTATADRLAQRYAADVETMEGFSVLRAAAACGVPALQVRGISNYVGDRADSEWNFEAGARAAARGLAAVLDRLSTA